MIVQRDVERHRHYRGADPEDRPRQQVPTTRPTEPGERDDAHCDGEQRRAEEHRQERRVRLRLGVDAAHRGNRLSGFRAVETLHHEGRERIEEAADGGAADRGESGQDDDGARVHAS